jgi:hypothetical protein
MKSRNRVTPINVILCGARGVAVWSKRCGFCAVIRVVLWCCGAVVLWCFGGAEVLWCYGALVPE